MFSGLSTAIYERFREITFCFILMRKLSDYLGTHKILFAGRGRKYRLVTEIYKEISQSEFQFLLITPSILGNMVSIYAVQSSCTA